MEKAFSQSRKEQGDRTSSEDQKLGQGVQCHAYYRYGNMAKYCRDKQKSDAEAPTWEIQE